MKNLLIAIVLLLTVSSCLPDKLNKDKDPEPELAGTYQVSRLAIGNSKFIPEESNISASAVVTRLTDTEIKFTVNTVEGGVKGSTDFGEFTIQKTSGRDYDVLRTSNRVGSINGTDFRLDYIGNNGLRFIMVSRK